MNEDQYEIEKAGEGSIQIRDLTTGIRFTFVIIDRKLNGILGDESNHLDPNLRNHVRSFVLHEARKRGLID
jgi:hypothetical protein